MGSNLMFLCVQLLLYLWVAPSSSDPSVQAHDFLRFADVERHCQSVLSSAAALADDSFRPTRLKYELSFEKGDWHQDAGAAPLMPFDGSDVPVGGACHTLVPLLLSTFVITHVDEGDSAAMAVNVRGVLTLSISRKMRDPETGPYVPLGSSSPEFKLSPGTTRLKVIFEGVYTENDDGEKVLCMVGNGLLPTRSAGGGAGPWDWARNSSRSSFLPPVTADDSVLLVLRYPKELTLTTRAVVGEMRSTHAASAAAYFDPVQLVSQLRYSIYRYRSDDLVAGACSPPPSIDADDDVDSRARHRYKGRYPCEVLERYGYGLEDVVTALPGRHCSSTATGGVSCSGLGPFEVNRPAAEKEELAGVRIKMQDLRCYTDVAGTVRVSVVFRAIPPWEDRSTAVLRSGMSGVTLSAEGVWTASAGQACLVACRGIGNKTCHFRVRLYVPMTLSITRRSVLFGRITSINAPAAGEATHSSLSFGLGLSLPQFSFYDGERLAFAYNYTKVKPAGELLRRSESPFGLRKIIAMFLPLSYPRAGRYVGDEKRSLASLAVELALVFSTMPSMFTPEWMEQPALHLDIIFLGQVTDRYFPRVNDASSTTSDAAGNGGPASEEQLLVNVSAALTAFGFRFTTPVVSLEGVYNPEDGRMYLIGCRDVRFLRRNSSTARRDLDEGMDCSIEVKVQYPPTTAHWFIWSAAKVHIASTRDAGDPLHFDPMKLRATPIRYPQPRSSEINRSIVNGVLCVILLSAGVAAALCQLRHLETQAGVAPYVSLVMLGVQAVGFGMPLVTGMEALLARPSSRSDAAMPPMASSGLSYALAMSRPYQSIDRAAKVLSLAAVAATLRIGLKVWRSRARALARSSPLEPGRVPGDGKVLVCHCAAQLVVFIVILALSGGQAMTVEQQVALMQDLFLLPQVVGNALWRVNCKPLAEGYYLGVTAARLLPRAYDAVRPPPVAGYSSESVDASRRVFSYARDVVIPAVAVLFALVMHVQQRWNYAIFSRLGLGMAEKTKLQHMF